MESRCDELLTRTYGVAYQLFSQGFSRPTRDFAQNVRSGVVGRALAFAFSPVASRVDVGEALDKLNAFEQEAQGQAVNEARLQLEVDFNRLFVGPGHLLAPPYESIYLSRHQLEVPSQGGIDPKNTIDGRAALNVRDIYREAGFRLDETYRDSADALFLELEFAGHLCGKEADALERDSLDEAAAVARSRREFLQNHLGRWLPLIEVDIARHAALGFYPAMIALARVLVEGELCDGSISTSPSLG